MKRGEADQLLQELEYADIKASNAAPPKKAKDETLSIAEMYARYSGVNIERVIINNSLLNIV